MLDFLITLCEAFGFIVDAFGMALIVWAIATSLARR